MIIIKQKHEGREEDVLAYQQAGWLYESHCWLDMFGERPFVCKWCGAKSSEDMKVDGHFVPPLCPGNPQVALALKQAKEEAGLHKPGRFRIDMFLNRDEYDAHLLDSTLERAKWEEGVRYIMDILKNNPDAVLAIGHE